MKTCDDFIIIEKQNALGTSLYYIKEKWKLFGLIPVCTYLKSYCNGDSRGRFCVESIDEVKDRINSLKQWYNRRILVKTTQYSACKLFGE